MTVFKEHDRIESLSYGFPVVATVEKVSVFSGAEMLRVSHPLAVINHTTLLARTASLVSRKQARKIE